MTVLITGGAGFMGGLLARALLARGHLAGPDGRPCAIGRLRLADIAPPPGPADPRVEALAADLGDPRVARALVTPDVTSIFHLASIVSAGGERDFDTALRVNLDGGRHLLEAARAIGGPVRFVFVSSVAVYGGPDMGTVVDDMTRPVPATTYGMTKAVMELLIDDYTRKGFIDGRTTRPSTVIVRPGAPNAAASGFASAVFREPLAGVDYTLPVPPTLPIAVIGHRAMVDGLIRLHEVDAALLGPSRAFNLPSLRVTVADMLAALERAGAGRRLGRVTVAPDPAIERICASWPAHIRADRATALGLRAEPDLDAIIRAYREDFAPAQ